MALASLLVVFASVFVIITLPHHRVHHTVLGAILLLAPGAALIAAATCLGLAALSVRRGA
jgi:hypothetical protein